MTLEWELYEERVDGGDAAKEKEKTLIKCVSVELCGEDNLLSLSQIAKLPATEYTACILTIALNKHWWINQEEHTLTLPPHLNVLTPGGHLLVLFSSSIIYL